MVTCNAKAKIQDGVHSDSLLVCGSLEDPLAEPTGGELPAQ